MGVLLPAFSLLTRFGTQQRNKDFDLPMKKRQKRRRNKNHPTRDDATELLPSKNEQMLRRCVFFRGRGVVAFH